jgi:hypothetical protein
MNEKTSKILAQKRSRRQEFQTRTVLCEKDGKKWVYKEALTGSSQEFVRRLIDKEKSIEAFFGDVFSVNKGVLEGDRVRYAYLPFQSLADRMKGLLANNGYREANRLFDEYVDRMHKLNRRNAVAEEFFKSIVKRTFDRPLEVFTVGTADLTPRNIFLTDSRWVVLDSEWVFDFAVPVVFVIFRAIFEMAVLMQQEIRASIFSDNPAMALFGCRFRKYYVPLAWLRHVVTNEASFDTLLSWEAGFQDYVMGENVDAVGRIRRQPRLRTSPVSHNGCSGLVSESIKHWIKALPGVRKTVHFFDM